MKRALLFLGVLGLWGCSTFPTSVRKPTVELASVGFEDPTLSAATLVFGIRVDNPNSFAIPLAGLQYNLAINGSELATGVIDDVGRLPKNDKTVVTIPVRLSYSSLYRLARTTADSGKLQYELKGNVSASGIPLPFTLGGNLNLPAPHARAD
jgi:LEA14-like dessication related protein